MAEFDPRSGKAADLSEITYTGTDDSPYTPGDEVPDGASVINVTGDDDDEPKYVLRRFGVQKTLKAADGVFTPRSAEDVAALDSFGLPVARKAETKATGEAGKGD